MHSNLKSPILFDFLLLRCYYPCTLDSTRFEFSFLVKHRMDSGVGYVRVNKQDSNGENEERQNNMRFAPPAENTFFRDILCLIVASIVCCPVCPCLAWWSIKVNQDALDAYWRGDYHNAAVYQSCAIKWCLAHVLLGLVFSLVIFAIYGTDTFDYIPIDV